MLTTAPELFNAADYLVHRRVALGDGDRVALRFPGGELTYAEVSEQVRAVAAGLAALGVRAEERVMFFAADTPELVAGILGAMHLGAVAVPVSTMLTADDLHALLVDARARVLVTSADFSDTARIAVDTLVKSHTERGLAGPDLVGVITIGTERSASGTSIGTERSASGTSIGSERSAGGTSVGTERSASGTSIGTGADEFTLPGRTWSGLLDAGAGRAAPLYPSWADSPALWLYTSGTTGSPKAAMHRHGGIRFVCETYGQRVLGIGPDDLCFSVAKLFFAYGIGNSLFFPFSVGAATVLEPGRPSPDLVAEVVTRHRPTLFFGVPTFYSALLSSSIPDTTFASVRQGVSAGEPLPVTLFTRVRDRFGFEILDGIGSTEALHIFLSNAPGAIRPGSSGTPVPGYQVRILDETSGEVITEPDRPGALYVCGESIATGYWCRAETTRRAFQGEWLRTGDTYVCNTDGTYSYLGRSDDMIKAGGIWVSPSEVEARLLEHADVVEVAVVGLRDADGLEKPVAAVVVRPGATVREDELVEFCRAGLAAFKRPRRVIVVDSLPKTATGKLQRYLVRAGLVQMGPEMGPEAGGPAR